MTKSKYNNKIIQRKDGKFDSKKEYAIWIQLKHLEKLGQIKNLKRQVPFILIAKSKWGRERKYIADFVFTICDSGEEVIADCKSSYTKKDPVFNLKARIFAEKFGKQITIIE